MTIQALLDLVDGMYPNAESDAIKVGYMNLAQEDISPYFGLVVEDDTTLTVDEQDAYEFPTGLTDVTDIISLGIGGSDDPDDRYDYTKYTLVKVNENPMVWNSFYQVIDSSGTKKFAVYPVPATDDYPIVIRFKKALTALSTTVFTGSPEFNSNYHSMLAYYCAYMLAFTTSDDDKANGFMAMYDARLTDIWRKAMDDEIDNPTYNRDNDQWHSNSRFVAGY